MKAVRPGRKLEPPPIRYPGPFWMPVAPDGWACTDILMGRRYNAIEVLRRKPWMGVEGKTWEQLRREGWRVVKVRIVPAEAES